MIEMDLETAYEDALEKVEELEIPEKDRDSALTSLMTAKLLEEQEATSTDHSPNNDNIEVHWSELDYNEGDISFNLLKLIEKGFFSEPRCRKEIIQEFDRKAMSYKSKDSFNSPLRKFVNKGYLDREKRERDDGRKVWHYYVPSHVSRISKR